MRPRASMFNLLCTIIVSENKSSASLSIELTAVSVQYHSSTAVGGKVHDLTACSAWVVDSIYNTINKYWYLLRQLVCTNRASSMLLSIIL